MSFLCVFGTPFSAAHRKMFRNSTCLVLLISTRTGTILGKMTSVVTIEASFISPSSPALSPTFTVSLFILFSPFLMQLSHWIYVTIFWFVLNPTVAITFKSFKFGLPFSGKFRRSLSFPHFSISWPLFCLKRLTNWSTFPPVTWLICLNRSLSKGTLAFGIK